MIKEFVKKIPGAYVLYELYIKLLVHNQSIVLGKTFKYYKRRIKKYSGVKNKDKDALISSIILLYHSIEKGFSMPEFRYGFGQAKVVTLIKLINRYVKVNSVIKDSQFYSAISVLLEYRDVHKKEDFQLDKKLKHNLDYLLDQYPDHCPSGTILTNQELYYSRINKPFNEFSNSRHSVRNFSGNIEVTQIQKAVELARNSPSACNRQPSRVHLIANKELISKCLKLQNGNLGFGHSADKLLIVTGDMRTIMGYQEFADIYTNVGMFIMNLSYSLHFNKVAHCILNWHVIPKDDKRIRKVASLPENELIMAFILCGNVEGEFKLITSPRRETNEILTITY